MALIHCPKCNKEISDKAVMCPQCGNVMRAFSHEMSTVEHEQVNKAHKQLDLKCFTLIGIAGLGFPLVYIPFIRLLYRFISADLSWISNSFYFISCVLMISFYYGYYRYVKGNKPFRMKLMIVNVLYGFHFVLLIAFHISHNISGVFEVIRIPLSMLSFGIFSLALFLTYRMSRLLNSLCIINCIISCIDAVITVIHRLTYTGITFRFDDFTLSPFSQWYRHLWLSPSSFMMLILLVVIFYTQYRNESRHKPLIKKTV